MTRKEQKEEKKQKILMTALTLFVERGYYDTKITDIAAAVPMSTGLMFHYFESKEELLLELVKMGAAGTKAASGSSASMNGRLRPTMFSMRRLWLSWTSADAPPARQVKS